MKKIIKKAKKFYQDKEDLIKLTAGVISVGMAITIVADNIRMRYKLKEIDQSIDEAIKFGKDTLEKSQSIIKKLVKEDKIGSCEWTEEVINSTYTHGCLVTLDTIGSVIKDI